MPECPANQQVFINRASGKIYALAGVATDTDQDSENFGVEVRHLVRLFDNFSVRIGGPSFEAKYRPATPEENASLIDEYARLQTMGRAITVNDLPPSFASSPARAPTPRDAEESESMMGQNPSGGRGRGRRDEQPEESIGMLVEPDARCVMEKLVVEDTVKSRILTALDFVTNRDALDSEWGMDEINPQRGRCILNLVGEPGTGKTYTAKIIAKMLGKKLFQVDYSSIISKWVGDTGKHIKAAFAQAKEHGAILFWDEADSLMSRRVAMTGDAVCTSVNQNRNIMMQEMDRWDGIMLTATNFFENFDPAMLRRISDHINFPLPTAQLRERLFDIHIPVKTKAKYAPENPPVLSVLAESSDGFSGGDILVVCENAIKAAFSDARRLRSPGYLSHHHMMEAVASRRHAKLMHARGHNAAV